jgi:hypothetical protein
LDVDPADFAGRDPHLCKILYLTEGIDCLLSDSVDSDILSKFPWLRVVNELVVVFDNIDLASCSS